ncbi:unnamed protein product [Brachionus calyciflorus]|uniref:Uncharacterized protein n=1 Tax=Brachionus calyciflorus TaxID=104777 RepID=A0A813P007_9BILA|nr:unnamed protein product [Brachionus calyciflorus]
MMKELEAGEHKATNTDDYTNLLIISKRHRLLNKVLVIVVALQFIAILAMKVKHEGFNLKKRNNISFIRTTPINLDYEDLDEPIFPTTTKTIPNDENSLELDGSKNFDESLDKSTSISTEELTTTPLFVTESTVEFYKFSTQEDPTEFNTFSEEFQTTETIKESSTMEMTTTEFQIDLTTVNDLNIQNETSRYSDNVSNYSTIF